MYMEEVEALIQKHRDGDAQAFEELVNMYTKQVYAFVYRSIADKNDASDIVQEVFLKVWRHLDSFDTTLPFKPWLFAIARRTTIDWLRKRRSVTFSDLSFDEENDGSFEANLPDPEPLPDELFTHKELAVELEAALAKLPPDDSMIVLLHLHDELTFEEIAGVMQKPMNTVKSQYRRALIKLRKILTAT